MNDWIHEQIMARTERMITWRRDFHRRPELGMEEHETAETIAGILKSFGLEVQTGIGQTGVVGLLDSGQPGKTLMLRADMDALPIPEKTGLEFSSEIENRMHACGHDGHMAIVLGLAHLLSENKDRFSGRVKFVFQPGEEGFGGAKFMIEDGAMTNPDVDAALALHLMAELPIGTVGMKTGPIMACADWWHAKFIGKGGHAATPDTGVDAIYLASQAITALQSLVSKESSPLTPFVVHVGTISGGLKYNVIAEEVEISGTVRTLDEELRSGIADRMDRLFGGITSALNGSHILTYADGYPPVVNDEAMTALVWQAAEETVPPEMVQTVTPSMGGDDMAYFLQRAPGCYFWVGASNPTAGIDKPHHNSGFDIDENSLAIGAEVMLRATLKYLND